MKIRAASLLLMSALVLFSAVGGACAYDFREDLLAGDEYFEEISALESPVLEALSAPDFQSAASSQSSLDFDSAVRVCCFEENEFLDALQTGFGTVLPAHERYVWKIPVTNLASGDAYAAVGVQEDGTLGYVTAAGADFAADLPYLYQREETDSLLSGLTFDSIYITSIPVWQVDFITVVAGNEVGLIPYAARPEFMELENGTYYTSEEISVKLHDVLTDMRNDGAAANGGSGSLHQIFSISILGGSAILLVCVILMVRGRKNRREPS